MQICRFGSPAVLIFGNFSRMTAYHELEEEPENRGHTQEVAWRSNKVQ